MSRQKSFRVVVCVAGLCLHTSAIAVPIVSSTFDTGVEGWTTVGPSSPLEYVPTNGNPGGHIAAQSLNPPDAWYFNAPAAFLGDKSMAYGGSLAYDLRGASGASLGGHPEVILANDSLTLLFDAGHSEVWTTYDIPLFETGFCSHRRLIPCPAFV